MDILNLIVVLVIIFITSIFGVVVGGNSFINIPAIILLLDLPAKVAIASNMFGLIFLSLSGGMRFQAAKKVNLKLLTLLASITLISSFLGAHLVVRVPEQLLRRTISIFMLSFVALVIARRNQRLGEETKPVTRMHSAVGYILTFVLGIYGGFFSGGYVTMLTLTYVTLFGMTFMEAAGITKFINVISSLIAALVFMQKRLVEYQLALPMAASMVVGAWIGASIAIKKGNRWIRNLFLVSIVALAIRLLFY